MTCVFQIFTQTKYISRCTGLVRAYSVFPKHYQSPVFRPEEQEELKKSKEFYMLSHASIKPSFTSDTSSEFYDAEIRKFTQYLLREGKKQLARDLVEKTFENVKLMQLQRYHKSPPEKRDEIELDPKVIFHEAIKNCKPILQLTRFQKGGITYQVPSPASENRSTFFAMNWMIEAAREDSKKTRFVYNLAKHLIEASNNQGRVVRKKQELHKQCEANKAYAHFRWSI